MKAGGQGLWLRGAAVSSVGPLAIHRPSVGLGLLIWEVEGDDLWCRPHRGDEVQGGEECAGALCSSSLRGKGTALVTVR